MKHLTKLLFIATILLTPLLAHAQGNTITITASGAPPASCAFIQIYIDSSTSPATPYYCSGGTYVAYGAAAFVGVPNTQLVYSNAGAPAGITKFTTNGTTTITGAATSFFDMRLGAIGLPHSAGFTPSTTAGVGFDDTLGVLKWWDSKASAVGQSTPIDTPTNHGVAVYSSTTPSLKTTAAGTSGQPLVSGGAGADPAYGTLGATYGGTGAAPTGDDYTPVADSASAITWRQLPNCTDTSGQHLNYTQSSNAYSCGTSGGSGIAKAGSAGAITGDSADHVILSASIPASTLTSTGCLRITAYAKHTTGSTSTTYKLWWNATINGSSQVTAGTTMYSNGSTSTNALRIQGTVCNDGATNSQQVFGDTFFQGAALISGPSQTTAAADTTGAVNVAFTFNVANTDAVTPYSLVVEKVF